MTRGPLQWLLQSITNLFVFHPLRGQHTQPTQLGMEFSDLRLVAEDGVRTQAWWMPSAVSDGALSGCTVITFHGNGGTMADRLDWCQRMVAEGASVLATEYRGYGESEGRPSESGCRLDAHAALAEARRLSAEGAPLLVHGRSLGGAVAIGLAAEAQVDGLIVESTFTRVADMAALIGIPFASALVAYRFDSVARLDDLDAPVFLVHGTGDTLIPFSMAEVLRDTLVARGAPVTFLPVAGGEHNSTWQSAGESYWEALRHWRQDAVRPV
jgi:fermentation-respiration switch protein FrsA (DUF1100 family)